MPMDAMKLYNYNIKKGVRHFDAKNNMKNNMRIIGIIPARYASTRFPGKPLADICGKPMIWWVYKHVSQIEDFDEVYVATDNEKIAEVCEKYRMRYMMTKDSHANHILRVAEVAEKVPADYYICVNGDEPLMNPQNVKCVLPDKKISGKVYVGYLMRNLTDPAETMDSSNIKLAVREDGRIIYMSRMPIPFPKGTLDVTYKKLIGVECFNKESLEFFANAGMGMLEKIEDIDPLRFIEYGHEVYASLIDSDSLAVDTKNDLERVRTIMQTRIDRGEDSNAD